MQPFIHPTPHRSLPSDNAPCEDATATALIHGVRVMIRLANIHTGTLPRGRNMAKPGRAEIIKAVIQSQTLLLQISDNSDVPETIQKQCSYLANRLKRLLLRNGEAV